jgi:acetyl esterase/lipase
MIRRGCAMLAMLLAAIGFLPAEVRAGEKGLPAGIEFHRDVVYGKGGGIDLTLNLSRPKQGAEKKFPCIVIFHGGGWAAGKKEAHDDLTMKLAAKGYAAATVGYRFAPPHLFPAQIEDAKCAVRYLRAHAEKYGIDNDRFGAIGFSAGAHLSMMLGTTNPDDGLEGNGGWQDQSSRVQAVVSFVGPTDCSANDLPLASRNILKNFLGGTKAEKPELYKKASPVNYVRPDAAPMLLFAGTVDPLVPLSHSVRMAEAMTNANVEGRVELLIGEGHGWGGAQLLRTADASFAFFDEHLKMRKPAGTPATKPVERQHKPKAAIRCTSVPPRPRTCRRSMASTTITFFTRPRRTRKTRRPSKAAGHGSTGMGQSTRSSWPNRTGRSSAGDRSRHFTPAARISGRSRTQSMFVPAISAEASGDRSFQS